MNLDKFTIKSQEALQKSAEIASGLQQQSIEPGHLLKAILETDENVSNYPGSKRIYQTRATLYFKMLKKNCVNSKTNLLR